MFIGCRLVLRSQKGSLLDAKVDRAVQSILRDFRRRKKQFQMNRIHTVVSWGTVLLDVKPCGDI
jgi:hypothetical protein